ncbi:unnamed protein product [Didymodactylos carnosus]|uniref:FLYWCH-type domain-containing protein n=1 Tax=Didymodactylos carnosus TaxID=1234261 RepID=A0A814ET25_9BILA|nr:unnamed protein product [Didymodactylos carnosus]CAF1064149.1 unnamed protein product [Didymodactylos carnosus]CAF3746509.1 unnamed protein product [Didymodactylos carnosus]CAF3829409.1 unnamed protein product [Didymodactylos carnosus]
MSVTVSKTSKNAPLLLHNGFSYIVDRKNEEKIYWKCEFQKKCSCHARLHTDLYNVIIKVVGGHENHSGNPRSEPVRGKLIKEENNLHSDIVNAKSGSEPTIQKQYESLNKRLHSLVKNPHPTLYDQLQATGRLLSL